MKDFFDWLQATDIAGTSVSNTELLRQVVKNYKRVEERRTVYLQKAVA